MRAKDKGRGGVGTGVSGGQYVERLNTVPGPSARLAAQLAVMPPAIDETWLLTRYIDYRRLSSDSDAAMVYVAHEACRWRAQGLTHEQAESLLRSVVEGPIESVSFDGQTSDEAGFYARGAQGHIFEFTPDPSDVTVLHECAHALTSKDCLGDHGPEFQQAYIALLRTHDHAAYANDFEQILAELRSLIQNRSRVHESGQPSTEVREHSCPGPEARQDDPGLDARFVRAEDEQRARARRVTTSERGSHRLFNRVAR